MSLLKSLVRWLFVLAGAAVGSYTGRAVAAALRGEPVRPLLRLDRVALVRQDLVPGFVAVELLGRLLKLGPWGAALVAAVAAAAAAFVDGPLVREEEAAEHEPALGAVGELGSLVPPEREGVRR